MAQTLEEIKLEIINAKNSYTELAVVNSASKSALWRLFVYVAAMASYVLQKLFDKLKLEVDTTLALRQPATPSWYAERVKDFQLGDQLVVINGQITYAVIDESKRIITRAAYKDASGTLTLKVAKGVGAGTVALSAEEVTQVESFLEKIKYAGTNINLTSLNADKLRLTAEIFYDGIYDLNTVKTAVKNALNVYMETLRFDGLVVMNEVIDAIQAVEGVNDVKITNLTVMAGATPTVVDRVHETAAGYIVEDDTENYTFDDLLTYTAA